MTCSLTRGRGTAFLALLLLLPTALLAADLPDFTALAARLSPAVVNISTTAKEPKRARLPQGLPPGFSIPDLPEDSPLNEFFRHFFEDQPPGEDGMPSSSLGSGFIVDAKGYVISNYHVVKDADEIIVRLSDRRELPATLVGSDPRSDIAVLKVETTQSLPALTVGRSETLKVGEWVLAIGSPFGFDHSVTAGIVSAKGRSLPNDNYVPFIQTDVAINPGNSGGPLFNLDGEVVGVNSQIYSRTGGFMGVSFAIPIDVVMDVYRQLRDKGEVTRGWLGVLIQDVTSELAESFQMQRPGGALVSRVLPGSPAEKAGIKAGDIVTRFDGHTIGASADLPPLVGASRVGARVPVEVLREGKAVRVEVAVEALPQEAELAGQSEAQPPASSEGEIARLKIKARALTREEREAAGLRQGGVLVEQVRAGPARTAGIRTGDVVAQIAFKDTPDLKTLKAVVAALKPGEKVPMLVHRDGNPLFMALEIPRE